MSKEINTLTDETLEQLGERIVDLFSLKHIHGNKNLYNTDWGTRTKKGLALTIIRIVQEETK